MAEHFRDSGRHALIVYDDLTKQAQAYRQLSLLLRRPPGREAYPGDVFYLHSRLLERAAKLSASEGKRILDGAADHRDSGRRYFRLHSDKRNFDHRWPILFGGRFFYKGIRPAVNVGKSVSRVGGRLKSKPLSRFGVFEAGARAVSRLGGVRRLRLGSNKASQAQLARGRRLVELMKQPQYAPARTEDQVVVFLPRPQAILTEFRNRTFVVMKKSYWSSSRGGTQASQSHFHGQGDQG